MAPRTPPTDQQAPWGPARELPGADALERALDKALEQALEQARDVFYIAVGLGVIGMRNADERSRQLRTALDDRVAALRTRLDALDLPRIDLPPDFPRLELPRIDLPRLELPGLDRVEQALGLRAGAAA